MQITNKRLITDRAGGLLITAFLLLLIYVMAAWSDISPNEYATRIISFTNTVAPTPVAATSSEPASATVTPTAVTMPKRAEITLDPVRIDLDRPTLTRSRVTPDAIQSKSILATDLNSQRPSTRQRNSGLLGIRRRVPRGLSSQSVLPTVDPSLELPETNTLDVPLPETDIPEVRETVDSPDVRVFDDSSLSTESEQTKEIVQWVIKHHIDIPSVVQRHMDFESGDRTSMDTIMVDNQPIEIYIVVRSGYNQLHVLLIDGDQSYFYINRGSRDQASRFRVGQVSRQGDFLLSRIISQERRISSDESQMFYRIFSDWWNTASNNYP